MPAPQAPRLLLAVAVLLAVTASIAALVRVTTVPGEERAAGDPAMAAVALTELELADLTPPEPYDLVPPASATGPSATPGDGPPGPAPLDGASLAADSVPSTGGYTDLIRRWFGPSTVEALVVVQCESGFAPWAVGTNTNGTQDHGLFQINDIHAAAFSAVTGRPWDDRYDAEANTVFARWLFDRRGWAPWTCGDLLDEPA